MNAEGSLSLFKSRTVPHTQSLQTVDFIPDNPMYAYIAYIGRRQRFSTTLTDKPECSQFLGTFKPTTSDKGSDKPSDNKLASISTTLSDDALQPPFSNAFPTANLTHNAGKYKGAPQIDVRTKLKLRMTGNSYRAQTGHTMTRANPGYHCQ